MSITFRCRCGKPLQTRDEAAGRAVKCPACGAMLKVPKPAESASRTRMPPGKVPPSPLVKPQTKSAAAYAKLVDNANGDEYPIEKDEVLLGRSKGADILFPVSAVSRKHCRIVRDNGRFYIEDLGSSFGTFVGGKRIDARIRIHDGTRIGLAASPDKKGYVRDLTFRLSDTPLGSRIKKALSDSVFLGRTLMGEKD